MSSTVSSALLAFAKEQVISGYIATSCMTLLAFEYIVTFQAEIQMIWQRKWTGPTLLFILNRYIALGKAALVLVPTTSTMVCAVTLRFLDTLSSLQYVVLGGFSALRVYALWGHNIWWFGIVAALNLIPPVYNVVVYSRGTTLFIPNPNLCTDTYGIPQDEVLRQVLHYIAIACEAHNVLRMIIATRLAIIVGDALVLFSTWYTSFDVYKNARKDGIRIPVIQLLIENGTTCFLALLVLNVLTMLCENVPSLAGLQSASLLAEAVTPILISRFLLNLRAVSAQDHFSNPSQMTGISFRIPDLIVGNLGEDLQFDTTLDEFHDHVDNPNVDD